MPCLVPSVGMWLGERQLLRKRPFFFLGKFKGDVLDPFPEATPDYEYVLLPCGTCEWCLLERSRQWAVRCMHEAECHDANCMVTLTYDDEHLPRERYRLVNGRVEHLRAGSLALEDFQDFMKRLRKRFVLNRRMVHKPWPDGMVPGIRFFHCGEYGATYGRPHYHALLFGFEFPDRVSLGERDGYPVWRSPILEALWPYGRSEIGSVTFESAAYVARYVMKKASAGVTDEYLTMSRRPGIGAEWWRRYGRETSSRGGVVVRGSLSGIPRSYRKLLAESDLVSDEILKAKLSEVERPTNSRYSRLASGVILHQRLSTFTRELK